MKDQWNAFFDVDLELKPTGEGSLSGLTFAVKDVMTIKGYKNSAGNPDWLKTHAVSSRHAPVIESLLQQGAKLHGTTHTDELMYSLNGENFHYGTPVNPKAPERIPGGSSSGSAVAVSSGLVDFALGTDTGGSVRIPSSYCGIYGFRPTHGVVKIEGVIPLAKSFDTVGWMAGNPDLLHKVGKILIDNQQEDGEFTNMVFSKEAWGLLENQYKEPLLRTISTIQEFSLQSEWREIAEEGLSQWSSVFSVLQGTEIWKEHGEWITKEKPSFGPGISERFQWTSTLRESENLQQVEMRQKIYQSMSTLLGVNGLLIIPTAPGPAPLLHLSGEKAEQYRAKTMQLSCIAGLAGLPQVTIPLIEVDGLPVGLSIIANRNQDLKLLNWVKVIFDRGDLS